MRQLSIAAFALLIVLGTAYNARALPTIEPFPSPSPVPSGISLPGLGKLLNNQGFQIWVLQNQVKTLQSQITALQNNAAAQQKAIVSQQQTIAALSGNLEKLQASYGKHTHLYENAGTAVYVDTIPQMYCNQTGPSGQCWSNGTLTILGYKGNAKMVQTSGPQQGP